MKRKNYAANSWRVVAWEPVEGDGDLPRVTEIREVSTYGKALRAAREMLSLTSLQPSRKLWCPVLHQKSGHPWRGRVCYMRKLRAERGYEESGGVQIEEAAA